MITTIYLVLSGIAAGVMWCIVMDSCRHRLHRYGDMWFWARNYAHDEIAHWRNAYLAAFGVLFASAAAWFGAFVWFIVWLTGGHS